MLLFFITSEKKNYFNNEFRLKLVIICHFKFTIDIMKIL